MNNKPKLIKLIIKGYSLNSIKYYINLYNNFLKNNILSIKMCPNILKRITVLKSPHKYKKAQEHYQIKIYKSILTISNCNLNQLKWLCQFKPQGIFLKIKYKE